MANDPLKDIEKFTKEIKKVIGLSTSRKNLTRYGNIAVKRIQARTSKGFGVARTGKIGQRKKGLKALATSTVNRRKRSKLHSSTSPGKSNLTFTGQLLESLKVKKINPRKGSLVISPEGRRRDGLANFEVAGFADEGGRPFIGLTREDLNIIRKEYQSTFSKLVRRRLT